MYRSNPIVFYDFDTPDCVYLVVLVFLPSADFRYFLCSVYPSDVWILSNFEAYLHVLTF